MSQTTNLLSAFGLIESRVCDNNGKRLGEIEDLILDMPEGSLKYLVFSFGGVFGIGHKLCVVTLQHLDLDAVDQCFRLDCSRRELGKAPTVGLGELQALSQDEEHLSLCILSFRHRARHALAQAKTMSAE